MLNQSLHQKQFQDENDYTAEHGNREQTGAHPGSNDSAKESADPCDGRLGGLHDGREGHDSQRDIGYIVKKGPQKAVLYLFSDQCQWQDTNRIGDTCHNENI